MFGKIILFVFLFIFLIKCNVAFSPEHEDNQTDITRNLRHESLFDTFNNLIANVKRFFGMKSKRIEQQKKEVKSAFEVIFKELTKKKTRLKPGSVVLSEQDILLPVYPFPKLKNYTDYKPRNDKQDIGPETSADYMIRASGYMAETHTVLTQDGYMISMQRVIPEEKKRIRRSILMYHGIYGSSEDWLLLGKERALPYLLTDNGFDVWLLNARGNRYSKIHTKKNVERLEFWDFSFHEMGIYDLPAAIRYINEITNNAEINFIGHSMGATALLVLLSTAPEYNYILRSGILLAPLAFMFHVRGPMKVLADFYRINGPSSLNFLGQTQFMKDETFPEQIIEKYCKGTHRACQNPLLLLTCGGKEPLNKELADDILAHVPGGGSVKTILHYVQLVKSGYFQMFDWGAGTNMKKYGNSTPPSYNLNRVTLPLAFFTSPSDWLATGSDIQTLLPVVQHVHVHHVLKADGFNHYDFVWSQEAPELVYNFVITTLEKILPRQDSFFEDT